MIDVAPGGKIVVAKGETWIVSRGQNSQMAEEEERHSTSLSETRRHAQPAAGAAAPAIVASSNASDGPHLPPVPGAQQPPDEHQHKDNSDKNNIILPATAMEASDSVAHLRLTTEAASIAVSENSGAGDPVGAEPQGAGHGTEFVEVQLQDGQPEQPGKGTSSRIRLFVLICDRGGGGGYSADKWRPRRGRTGASPGHRRETGPHHSRQQRQKRPHAERGRLSNRPARREEDVQHVFCRPDSRGNSECQGRQTERPIERDRCKGSW